MKSKVKRVFSRFFLVAEAAGALSSPAVEVASLRSAAAGEREKSHVSTNRLGGEGRRKKGEKRERKKDAPFTPFLLAIFQCSGPAHPLFPPPTA